MTIIELELKVENVMVLKNVWAIDLFGSGANYTYCVIQPDGNVSYEIGVLRKGFGHASLCEAKIFKTKNGKYDTYYLDQDGNETQVACSNIVESNVNYRYKVIERKCVLNDIFGIDEGRLGIAIKKENGNDAIVSVPDIFGNFHQSDITKINMIFSGNDQQIMIWQYGKNQIVLMDNPLR